MRAVTTDTTDALVLDMVHEASVEDYQGKKLIMHEKPELGDGTLPRRSKCARSLR
jgi:hypothetical protein